MSTDERSDAVAAGRGVLYIAGAKMYFLFAGFAIETALPRLLGRFAFGAYGVVNQAVSIVNNVVVAGTIQAVSRETTADPERADVVKAAGLRMHLLLGLPLAILFAAGAPVWAYLVHDPGKAGPLALSAAIVALYAFYTVLVGSANGTRQFHKQAALDVTSATLRAGGMIGAAALGLGVWGAISAWVAAAGGVLLVSMILVGLPKAFGAGAIGPMARFLGGMVIYLALMNLILAVDQLLLKRLVTEWFHARPEWLLAHGADPGQLAGAASMQADGQVAYYRAVQTLARLPYQLMIAVTFVVFPLVSRATFQNDAEKTRGYVKTTMRYSLIFATLMGAVLAANPGGILGLPYPQDYAVEGAAALAFLSLGSVAFSLFHIAGTILNGAGRTRDAVMVAGVTLVLLVAALWILVPRGAPGHEVLSLAAASTTGAMVFGALLAGIVIWRRFGAFLPVLTMVRVAVAGTVTIVVGRALPFHGKLMTLAAAAACALVYLGLLVATRELAAADLAAVKRIVGRKR